MSVNYYKSRRNWRCLTGTTVAIILGVAVIGYYTIRGQTGQDKREKDVAKKSYSQCIIVSKNLSKLTNIDWKSIMQLDAVLLVVPNVEFVIDIDENYENNYKIINCDTMSGLWSCIRHLGKDRLIYDSAGLIEDIPSDIPRYTNEIIDLRSDKDTTISADLTKIVLEN